MNLLPANLAPLASVAAKESTKFAMTGVQVEVNADNTYRAVATDAKRLLMVEGPCENSNEFPDLPAIAGAPNGGSAALVPAKAWASTFAAAAKLTRKVARSKPALGNVATVIGKDVVTFGATDLEQTAAEQTRQLDGRFPPYREIFPKKGVAMAVTAGSPWSSSRPTARSCSGRRTRSRR